MDRLNELPDEIRNKIVSFLPTKDAIQTSVLSTQWRYISSYLSQLEFRQWLHRTARSKTYGHNFRNCVSRTLFLHDETPLESLSLSVVIDDEYVTSKDLSNWVTCALSHKLRRFSLDACSLDPIYLPTKFFQGGTLQYLNFKNFRLRITSSIRFLNLKTLVLYGVRFYNHNDHHIIVNKLFQQSTFPVLEDLEIRNCPEFHTLCFSIPSLLYLKVFASRFSHRRVFLSIPSLRDIIYVGCCPVNICSKTLAALHSGLFEFPPNENPNTDASDILFGLCNVETLWLKAPFIESLANDQLFFGKFPILSATLKHLHLDIYRTEKQTQVISFLIRCFTQLQTLHIYCRDIPEYKVAEDEYGHPSDLYLEDISMFSSLKGIEFNFFGETEAELSVVRYLLQRASNLMELNVRYKEERKESQKTISEKLLALPRASHHVTFIC